MVVYLCCVPNNGGRIGHQSYQYFVITTYCKKYNINYVYHPFMDHSNEFDPVLKFNELHTNTINDDFIKNLRRIDIFDIHNDLHNNIIKLHQKDENILIFGKMQIDESIICLLYDQITEQDLTEMKLLHRRYFTNKYPKIVNNEYICIHIRYGDCVDNKSRLLNKEYYLEKYNYLKNIAGNITTYIVTEENNPDDEFYLSNIPNCKIIKESAVTSFYYLVNCNYLIASRSGFSNLAYILGNMKVIIPPDDWNIYYDNIIC